MSWNAHTDYLFHNINNAKENCVPIEFLYLGGPCGEMWGKSGDTSLCISPENLVSCKTSPHGGVYCDDLKERKCIFIREFDNIYGFNKDGKSLAIMFCMQYIAYAVASENFKIPDCIDCLTQVKEYMSTHGYN